jgi:hypothetical protein
MRRRKLGRKILGAAVAVALLWSARGVFAGEQLPIAPALVVTQAWMHQADTLKRDETLSDLLARHNIVGQELYDILQAADEIDPRRLRAGQVFEFRYAMHEPAPDQMSLRLGDSRLLKVVRDTTAGWRSESTEIYWTVTTEVARGEIRSSLYETVDELIPSTVLPSGERARLVWDLADGVFGWVIDFARDNYAGDDFQIVYERLSSELGDVRFGRIVAAKVETRGRENAAYVMTDTDGRNAYYDPEGNSLKRAFKLYPAEFRRISSGFSRNRSSRGGLRCEHRNSDRGHGRWYGAPGWSMGYVWHCRHDPARKRDRDTVWAHESGGFGSPSRSPGEPGPGDWLCGHDGNRNGSAPALRVHSERSAR